MPKALPGQVGHHVHTRAAPVRLVLVYHPKRDPAFMRLAAQEAAEHWAGVRCEGRVAELFRPEDAENLAGVLGVVAPEDYDTLIDRYRSLGVPVKVLRAQTSPRAGPDYLPRTVLEAMLAQPAERFAVLARSLKRPARAQLREIERVSPRPDYMAALKGAA